MKLRLLAMLVLVALALSGCGYLLVEDDPVQVGSAIAAQPG